MNTTNILLATTSILIVVAFGLSFQGFSKNRNSPENKSEAELLRQQVEALAAQRRILELENARADDFAREATPDPGPDPLPVAPGTVATELDENQLEELEQMEATIEEQQRTIRALEGENEMADEERNEIRREQIKAAKRVRMALKMGSVISANKESGFVIFEPARGTPNHQPGKVLAVRRNSGILGEIQVDRLDESGKYVATMRPQVFAEDNYPEIRPGDEIIVDPN